MQPRPFSLSTTEALSPEAFRRWAMAGATLAALAYSLVAAVAFWQAGSVGAFSPYTQLGAALACWVAAAVAATGRARWGILLTLAAVWVEVHAGFVVAPSFPAPGLLVAPVLVTASGLLLGQRAALLVAVSSVLAATPMYLWGLARASATVSPTDLYWLTVHGTVTLASWGLIAISLAALQRVVRAVQHAEQAQRDAETQLAHTQRLEAIGMLAGGVAHDFNNVLTTIGGSAHLLRDESNEELRVTLLDDIEAAQDRGATLTRQLLAFARRDVVSPEVLDLGTLVTESQRLLQRLAGERIPISCDVAPDVRVRADVPQLEQVLANLITNARDAMRDGGTCTMSVRAHTDADGTRWARLRVSDTGIGMNAHTAARAFEPFFTTKDRGQGTGLGLASVHGIVLQSEGRAHIESAPGVGTSIVLDFPRVDAPLDAQRRQPGAAPFETRGVGSVLVADDDDGTRAVVGRILQRAGYRVHLVPDGMQALRQLESDPTAFDLLVTDVVMPGLTGPQLASRVRAKQPTLPILFMSGYPEDALDDLERLGDSTGFLSKPFSGSELTQRVAEQLRFPGQ